jgi:hypothetical protein
MTKQITLTGEDIQISDGYHTFDELYDHRITLFVALCRCLRADAEQEHLDVYRSKLHHDGSALDGWYLLGLLNMNTGEQITYHLPLDRWDETNFARTMDRAHEWDGHTPQDVLARLAKL